jgi:acetyl esterase/lipase
LGVRRYGAFGLALIGLAVSACSPLDVLNSLVPETSYRLSEGIAYGPHSRQRLDVYRPATDQEPSPAVIFFYGGAWKSGDRKDYRFVGESLARRGLTAIIPDYRLYPEVRFPAFVEDGAAATRWVLDQIGPYGADPHHVFLTGHSAGAYIAAMLAVDPSYLKAVGKSPADICGVISVSGPISFDPLDFESTRPIFEDAPDQRPIRPIKAIHAGAPPFLLLHGLADETVYPENATKFEEALNANQVPVSLQLVPGIGHYRIIAGMASPLEGWLPVLGDRFADFIRRDQGCLRDS